MQMPMEQQEQGDGLGRDSNTCSIGNNAGDSEAPIEALLVERKEASELRSESRMR
jgi:hypothetical protein